MIVCSTLGTTHVSCIKATSRHFLQSRGYCIIICACSNTLSSIKTIKWSNASFKEDDYFVLTGVITGKRIVVVPVSIETVSGSGEFVLGLTTLCKGSSSSPLVMQSNKSGDKICWASSPLSELVSERGRSITSWTPLEPVTPENISSVTVSIPDQISVSYNK